MPCIIHEETIFLTGEYITETFKSAIEKVPDDFSFKLQLLDGINRKMSWPVPYSYNGKDRKLYPDIAFPFYLPKGHRNNPEKGSKSLLCKYPGLVMEVGYSQTLESLRNYVKYYLLRMEFGVNKVILVKIDPKTKRSTLECWERCKKNINGTEYWCVQMCRVYRSKSVMVCIFPFLYYSYSYCTELIHYFNRKFEVWMVLKELKSMQSLDFDWVIWFPRHGMRNILNFSVLQFVYQSDPYLVISIRL